MGRQNIPDSEIWSWGGNNDKPDSNRFEKGNESGQAAMAPKDTDHNFQMNRADQNIQFILRNAKLPWDETENYPVNAVVYQGDKEYKAKTANTGKNPAVSPSDWEWIDNDHLPDASLTQKGITQLSNVADDSEDKAATPFSVMQAKNSRMPKNGSSEDNFNWKGKNSLMPSHYFHNEFSDEDRSVYVHFYPNAATESYKSKVNFRIRYDLSYRELSYDGENIHLTGIGNVYHPKNIPTAGDVGARPDDWMPTASDVGAVKTHSYTSEIKAGKWSRIVRVDQSGGNALGAAFRLIISFTRTGIVVQQTFDVSFSHPSRADIICVDTAKLTPIEVRAVVGNSGTSIFFEALGDGSGYTSQLCDIKIILNSDTVSVTEYNSFTDGSTIPTGYVVAAQCKSSSKSPMINEYGGYHQGNPPKVDEITGLDEELAGLSDSNYKVYSREAGDIVREANVSYINETDGNIYVNVFGNNNNSVGSNVTLSIDGKIIASRVVSNLYPYDLSFTVPPGSSYEITGKDYGVIGWLETRRSA